MNYASVDPVLESWAKSRGLHIYRSYKDTEVRSIDIVSPQGKRFQLWIDEPGTNGATEVHIWDMRKRRKDYSADIASLRDKLEKAYQQAQSWF